MKINYTIWDDVSVLASEIRDMEANGASQQFIELTYPVLLEHILKMITPIVPSKIKVGRPLVIAGALRKWVLGNARKMSARKMQKELASIGIKVHHNSILNVIRK